MPLTITRLFARLLRLGARRKFPTAAGRARSRDRGRPRLGLDLLEARVVPAPLVAYVLSGTASTTVSGIVYEDLDSSGTRTNGENGVSGWTVYLDLDNSGTLNRDAAGDLEPSAVTNQDGVYTIGHLMPGTYRVAEVMQPGWEPTAPVSQDVVVVTNRSTRADFFNFSGGDIVGAVWNDLSADGTRDPGEPGLAGWTVFLDDNNNRAVDPVEVTTLTDADGNYDFRNLPPNDYEVTVLLPAGWDISPGFDNRQTVAVVARTEAAQDYAFFSLLNGSIQGTVWNDANIDGVRNVDPATGAFTEPGLAGWIVFLDANNNRLADPGEPATITDATGSYSFISLPEGDYEVTEVLPGGWDVSPGYDSRQTVAVFAGEATTAGDFANFTVLNGSVRGTIWNDLNRNGVRDRTPAGAFTDPGMAGWGVYLDLNGSGVADPTEPTAVTDAAGAYAFADLQVGDYDVREVLPTGWEPTTGYGDNVTVRVYSGAESVAPDLANFNLATATAGSVSGTVWNDLNGNGVRDAAGGAFTDPGLAGVTVFVDRDGNGVLDPTEASAVSGAAGAYTISGVLPGTVTVVERPAAGWRPTAPTTASRTIALRNAEDATGLNFGNWTLQDSAIRGGVFADTNANGTRDPGERGLDGVTVYLDLNNNGALDAGEPQTATSADQFYTPAVDEAGTYAFTHLAAGTYTVRTVVPVALSATPADQLVHTVTLAGAEGRSGVDTAARYRPTEIHGIKFDDLDGDHQRDAGEPAVGGVTIFVDLDRDDVFDAGEPTSVTAADGSYTFTGLAPGAYVVREVLAPGYQHTYPGTVGGTLWPQGVSNPAAGNVTPGSITASLAAGESLRQSVSITLPNTGALTNLVDVFLLFDDTGSFVNNSPIVRAAFPTIISQLQSSLPGIDLGFGVGRFEEYGNFAAEYATGRPFILNQPIVAASTTGYMTAIQAALNRTTPGYGGDGPETDIEALYQLVTGRGFDGNNNGSVLDSGAAGLASTQLTPGASGDVPSFASFTADPANNVMAAAGRLGGGGFRAGALPIILVATDIGFAYQPRGETTIIGVGGVTLPLSSFTQTSRPTTPFNAGAGIQETITGLNALGGLIIGLGTNPQANVDPRQGLESLSRLTGAVNRSAATIANGTADPIAPGDPLYFQISSGFAGSVAAGVTNAIQNAVTNVAVDITIQASDPRVRIVNHTGVRAGVGSGQTATFDIEFVGDGIPHRFDLQFVRSGTNVVLGSIPVILGTPVPGDGYEFEDLSEGEIDSGVDFGSHLTTTTTSTPTVTVVGGTFTYDAAPHAATASATGIGGAPVGGTFAVTYNGSPALPVAAGTYAVVATFTSSDPSYTGATGTATLVISPAVPAVAVVGGSFTYDGTPHAATATATGIGGTTVGGSIRFSYNGSAAQPVAAGTYAVVATFTSTDANYASASGNATLTISATTATVSVTGGTFTYDAATHAATATATGIGGAPVGGTFAFTYNGSTASPVAAGTYAVVATFTSSDPSYTGATGTATLVISPAAPAVAVVGGNFPYDGSPHAATAAATGIGGAPVGGTFAFSYNGSAALPIAAGTYAVVASFTSTDANYSGGSATGTVLIAKATPAFANLSTPVIGEGVASVTITGRLAAGNVVPVGAAVTGSLNGETRVGTVDATGNFSLSFPTALLPAGTYPVTVSYAGDGTNFNASADGSTTLTVTPAPHGIEATGFDVSAVAGAPVTRAVATVVNALGSAAAYAATIAWGDGSTSAGVVSGSGAALTVTGTHTYANPGTATIRVTVVDTLALGLSTTTTGAATVSSLGLAAGKTREAEYWHKSTGQALIRSFNGGATHTELASWLATTFGNLYGAAAGANDLTGKTNADVAALFQRLWLAVGDGAATQVLATALNVYATTASLGGTQGATAGFQVSAAGLGARSYNVRGYGAAVGVANGSTRNVFQLLQAVNNQVRNGVLYIGNGGLLEAAKELFSGLNSI